MSTVRPQHRTKGFCIEMVSLYGGWQFKQCRNPDRYGDFCGVHSPEKRAERAKKRGPTQYQRDCARWKARADRERALEDVLIAARRLTALPTALVPEARRALKQAIEHCDKVTGEG